MRKYKCIYNGSLVGGSMRRLTIGKVYDSIDKFNNGIHIIDDCQTPSFYFLSDDDGQWFIEVTQEYRNDIIDEILT